MKRGETFMVIFLSMVVGVNAQMGIGTTSVDGILHVDNGASDTDLILEKDAGTNASVIFHNAGVETANITYNSSEQIVLENDQSDGSIIFNVNDGGSDTEVMRVYGTSSYFGVGESTPTNMVHVKHGATGEGVLLDRNNASSRKSQLMFAQQGTIQFSVGIDGDNNLDKDFYIYDAVSAASRFFINESGLCGISQASPSYRMDVYATENLGYAALFFNDGNNANREGLSIQCGADNASTTGTQVFVRFYDGDGTDVGGLRSVSGTCSVFSTSDRRKKKNIQPTAKDGLAMIEQLRVVDFNWKDNPEGDKITGFIAQEVEEVYPDIVSPMQHDAEGTEKLSMSQMGMVPILTKAIQQQDEQIERLDKRVDASIKQLTSEADQLLKQMKRER